MISFILNVSKCKAKVIIPVMILLLIPVILSAQPAPMSQQDLALGGMRIGDSIEKVISVYGKPLNIKKLEQNSLQYTYKNIVFYFNRHSNVDYIRSASSDNDNPITTPRGIAVGNSVEDLIKAYGKPMMKDSFRNNIVGYTYQVRTGPSSTLLLFECDSSTNKIVKISLYDAV